jgi:TetR/AcrR family transcriptional regulator
MVQPAAHGVRAEKTRGAILEAAEALFAERGFDATRLEDIAERVGIRRASIVYYFKDKRELYEAVLKSVFGGLYDVLAEVLSRPVPLPERIEAGVSAWVDYVGGRPTLARFILREVANVKAERGQAVRRQTAPFAELIRKEVFERPDFGDVKLAKVDPVHLASIVAGSTVFFVAAMPALLPGGSFDPTSADQLAALKDELLRIVRRLAGTRGPRDVH